MAAAACAALLLSLLAAGAGELRSDSRLDKCLANLRQIGTAMGMYFQDNRDWFPHGHSNKHSVTGVYYGGHPGRPGLTNWVYEDMAYRTTPAGRPFNAYLYPGLPRSDIGVADPRFAPVRDVAVFHCPVDTGGAFNQSDPNFWRDPNTVDPNATLYFNWGTSYDSMYHWAYSWAIQFRASSGGGIGDPNSGRRWLHLANAFTQIQLRYHAATKVILYEDSLDSAQWNRKPRRGWHGVMNRQSVLFLDGHAANLTVDATVAPWNRGPGWKTCAGNSGWETDVWWRDSSDPDYKYRMIPPRAD